MQTALELYHLDAGEYPSELIPGEELKYEDAIYLYQIPENPQPSDGECEADMEYSYSVDDNGQNYELFYCLRQL